jgi:hypothetical protein
MSVFHNNALIGASGQGGAGPAVYSIERSLRFNSSDSAYLSRTPSVAGNRKTWTWAGWVKRSAISSTRYSLFVAATGGNNQTEFFFEQAIGADKLHFYHYDNAYLGQCLTAAVFRDTSAWYHIVLAVDTTQATASNRCKIYVNGVQQSTAFATNFTQNGDLYVNATNDHAIGYDVGNAPSQPYYFSGYLADIHFIDGQALDPSSFGEFDTNGVWQPIAYAGSYGTNGFHLPFSNNSTAAALGTDTSGNSNTWTVNNLSVTAGAGNDSLVDSPTNYGTDTGAGGEVRGNYATLNPLFIGNGQGATLSNGNLDYLSTAGGGNYATRFSTIGVSSGKWYSEFTINAIASGLFLGISSNPGAVDNYIGQNATSWGYLNNGNKWTSGGSSGYGASFTTGDVIGVALDLDAGTITFYKNGTSQGTAYSSLPTGTYFTGVSGTTNVSVSCNYGQRPFAYTAPSGFKALCTTNLPEGTITTSGTFTGNALADGPFVYLNGVPTAMTINGNAVTFATHADKLSNGFKVRTSSGSYNTAGSNTYSINTTGAKFKYARAQANP